MYRIKAMLLAICLLTVSCLSLSPAGAVEAIPQFVAVSAGGSHTLALTDKGEVYAWGFGYAGQLGCDLDNLKQIEPIKLEGLPKITAISAGDSYSLALDSDGNVWEWGAQHLALNDYFRSGLSVTPKKTPVVIEGLTDIVAISAGWAHSLALTSNGTVYALGENTVGQLGLDADKTLSSDVPVLVEGMSAVKMISAGMSHSLAVLQDGTVFAWGYNLEAECGVPVSDDVSAQNIVKPTLVKGLRDVIQVAASSSCSYALKENGTLWAWGSNSSIMKSVQSLPRTDVPFQLDYSKQIVSLSVNNANVLAYEKSNNLMQWGRNDSGEFYTVSKVPGLPELVSYSAGLNHYCAVSKTGEVYAWGYNAYGQCGQDSDIMFIDAPTLVPFSASEANREEIQAANMLYEMGLLKGVGTNADGSINFDLDRSPNRAEAVTLLVRLLGKEIEASTVTYPTPFTDVPQWADGYVGYAYTSGLTQGISATSFGADEPVSATQYLTYLLRALNYESGVDFRWDAAWELSDTLGITSGEYGENGTFTRGDAILLSARALDVYRKNSEQTLGQFISAGSNTGNVFTARQEVQLDGETVLFSATVQVVSTNQAKVTLDFPFKLFPQRLFSVRFTSVSDTQYRVAVSYGSYSPNTSLTGTVVPARFVDLKFSDLVEDDNQVTWTITVPESIDFNFDMLGDEYELSCQFQ